LSQDVQTAKHPAILKILLMTSEILSASHMDHLHFAVD
jgi:hypothetical protein